MSDEGTSLRGLWWEWLAARIIFVLGFGIVIAAALYLYFMRPQPPSLEAQKEAAGREFCTMTLGAAQSFGIVPGFARPTSLPQTTDTRGRYVCTAATQASKYALAVELRCSNITDKNCYSLVSITQDDGTVLYQRQ